MKIPITLAERAAFESAACAQQYHRYDFTLFGAGRVDAVDRTYLDPVTESAWRVWLAASRPVNTRSGDDTIVVGRAENTPQPSHPPALDEPLCEIDHGAGEHQAAGPADSVALPAFAPADLLSATRFHTLLDLVRYSEGGSNDHAVWTIKLPMVRLIGTIPQHFIAALDAARTQELESLVGGDLQGGETDARRITFERWATRSGYDTARSMESSDGLIDKDYAGKATCHAWAGWRAHDALCQYAPAGEPVAEVFLEDGQYLFRWLIDLFPPREFKLYRAPTRGAA